MPYYTTDIDEYEAYCAEWNARREAWRSRPAERVVLWGDIAEEDRATEAFVREQYSDTPWRESAEWHIKYLREPRCQAAMRFYGKWAPCASGAKKGKQFCYHHGRMWNRQQNYDRIMAEIAERSEESEQPR
jgi:hypothetical protein